MVSTRWDVAVQSRTITYVTRLFMIAAQMVPIFSIFAGGPLGSGKQWLEYLFYPHTLSAHMSSSIIASLISFFLCTTLLLCHQRKF